MHRRQRIGARRRDHRQRLPGGTRPQRFDQAFECRLIVEGGEKWMQPHVFYILL